MTAQPAQLNLDLDASPRPVPRVRRDKPRAPHPLPTLYEGPQLLVSVSLADDEDGPPIEWRRRACPRVRACEDEWIAQGRHGQARCPAKCPVWAAVGV